MPEQVLCKHVWSWANRHRRNCFLEDVSNVARYEMRGPSSCIHVISCLQPFTLRNGLYSASQSGKDHKSLPFGIEKKKTSSSHRQLLLVTSKKKHMCSSVRNTELDAMLGWVEIHIKSQRSSARDARYSTHTFNWATMLLSVSTFGC